jgi:redox-sensitive bicupin YhaK (pirin superfamily)
MENPSTVERVITAHRQTEGGGFVVRRPFPTDGLDLIDPFLLLDEMGPAVYGPGEAVGAPDHPHRGFETVTYMLEGQFEHEDSAGHRGSIAPGDVQWMTAGRGVVHSEMPSQRIRQEGGRIHGFQLWVNLPAKEKMTKPRYQEVPSSRIPRVTSQDGLATVRVIAGEALGGHAVIDTHTPISFLHWSLKPGAVIEQPLSPNFNAFVYVFKGAANVGAEKRRLIGGQLAVLQPGSSVTLSIPSDAQDGAELLIVAGQPIREPVARYGPFVMNTKAELLQAFNDFRDGRLGEISR